jgi:amino-acid N-acetyltransferase
MSMQEIAVLRSASDSDVAAVAGLLRMAELPTDGLDALVPDLVIAADAAGELVAAGAIERYGVDALLRSVVVAASARGTGLGRRVVEDRVGQAARLGISAVYLLTTTAEAFFARLRFEVVERDAVPEAVRGSAEFVSLCPASAVAMRRRVNPPAGSAA